MFFLTKSKYQIIFGHPLTVMQPATYLMPLCDGSYKTPSLLYLSVPDFRFPPTPISFPPLQFCRLGGS
jgi:hypothetical protein